MTLIESERSSETPQTPFDVRIDTDHAGEVSGAIGCRVAAVSGVLDDATAPLLRDRIMELVFALPAEDVVLDLRDVTTITPEGVRAIRDAMLALDDQGAELHLVYLGALQDQIDDAGIDPLSN